MEIVSFAFYPPPVGSPRKRGEPSLAPSPLTGRTGVGSPSPLTGRTGVGSPAPDRVSAVPPCSPPVNGGTVEGTPDSPSPLTGRAGVG